MSKNSGSSFYNLTTNHGLANNSVRTIFIDSNDVLYAGTSQGISRTSNNGSSFVNFSSVDGLINKVINSIAVDEKGKVYAASYDGGLFISK